MSFVDYFSGRPKPNSRMDWRFFAHIHVHSSLKLISLRRYDIGNAALLMPHNFCLGWITRIQNLENSRNTAYLYQMNRAKTTNLGKNARNYLIPIKIQARNRSNFGSNGLTNSFSITKSCLHWIYRYFVTTKVSLRNAVFHECTRWCMSKRLF